MARSSSHTKPAVTTVTLYLSLEEALVIRDIFTKIGGQATTTRRGHVDTVLDALETVPEVRATPDNLNFKQSKHGGLTFDLEA